MTSLLEFITGIGLFLFAMKQLEQAFKQSASGRLQKTIIQHTDNRMGAIGTGIVSTALVQSSSLVGLIVLALCGAGILPLFNAIGVMIGANLGTTFTGWLATFIGFKLNFTAFAIYLVGLGGLIYVFSSYEKLKNWSWAFIAIGLILMGLDLMKGSAQGLAQHFEIKSLQNQSSFYFLFFGILLSGIIQSSSAAMMITLSALNIEAISLQQAGAIVIGADLGTTSTVLLASIRGAGIKRQLAMAHLLFNVITDIIAFLLLLPFIVTITHWLKINDPLYQLVAFHSLFNFTGILIFLPALSKFSHFLEQKFKDKTVSHAHYINKVPLDIPAIAIQALQNESRELLSRALRANQKLLEIPYSQRKETYYHLKAIEGEILRFCQRLQKHALKENEVKEVEQLRQVVRYAIFSYKSLNDVIHDVSKLQSEQGAVQSESVIFQPSRNLFEDLKQMFGALLESLTSKGILLSQQDLEDYRVNLKLCLEQGQQALLEVDSEPELTNIEVSSLLNLNRELYNAGEYATYSYEHLNQVSKV
ncbi:Na/Pi cotransporter family protein [Aliikangiella sp. G2MR2-5]|uniref:Na/Pi cotransporter family protein n=1 Tax=Aliikangiella sp. G2MR2-5 TaxID=2788943 RepID=UPI0018A917E3|nr:Na/Pi symporter [Aliikangiella sp. G2MR2-5]